MKLWPSIATTMMMVLAGCQSAQQQAAVQRTTQVDATIQEFTDLLLQKRIARGYTIRQQTPNMIVLDRPAKDFATQFVYGSQWNIVPNYRLTYQMYGDKPLTVSVNGAIITNPGSGFERINDMSNHASMAEVMKEIADIASEIKSKR